MSAPRTYTPDQLWMPDVIADPYPAYAQFRDESPLQYVLLPRGAVAGLDAPVMAWALMRHDDAIAALRDHDSFASGRDPLAGKAFPKMVLLQDDPPRHSRFRQLVNKAFTMRRIEALAPWITETATQLLDAAGGGEIDAMASCAVPLPVTVIARLLGIPAEDHASFKRWSDSLLAISSVPPEERAKHNQEMMLYFGRMVAERRAHGAEDLITTLVESEIDGERLHDAEILGFCILLLVAGNETTTNLIGNLLGILADRPELWQRLREDRNLVEPVITETLRYESPVHRLPRQATRDIEIRGTRIPEGSRVSIFYGAANRDPAVFEQPDEFRPERDARNHLAFGQGIHYCLGAPLARAEAAILLNALLDRYPTLARGDAPAVRQRASLVVYGYERLPLKLQAR
jgi:cytochrome P450